jgi:L-ascorbate metabolism protein UlaG (beta-lactamase superfamily)
LATKLTWLSHGSWLIETGEHRILLDPFLTDNPTASTSPDALQDISYILVSHGHFDHIQDVASIANRCGATVVANFEVAQWFASQHDVAETIGMNLGGATELPFGRVKLVHAVHSSSFPDGSYAGTAGGFVLDLEGSRVYFACDTALFSDMRLFAHGVDLAVLPIGDLFTMGPAESVAAIELIEPKRVLPAHYGTWPPIAQDGQAWAELVRQRTSAEPHVLQPGESLTL